MKPEAGTSGAIACGHDTTAAAARRVLEAGGNAFDATVAAICAACVAEPVLCSLAGGGYLLARPAYVQPVVYDFFVDTPLARRPADDIDLHPVHADFGSVKQEFHIGMGSVATPGLVAGLFAIHRELCSLPFGELVEPAVDAARGGVQVNALQAYIFDVVAPIYVATREARAIYAAMGDSLPRAGTLFRQPDLADTFGRLAHEGPDLFYRGEFAARLVEACEERGGQLALEDLARYRVERRPALSIDYRMARVFLNPPPSCGGMLIAFALELLRDVAVTDRRAWLQTLVEAMRLTNLARAECAEPLHDRALLDRCREQLHGRLVCNRGTTHISVIDGAGNIAAASLSNGEGCGHVLPGSGIMLNNMLGEEDLNPAGFQQWLPGTRMASMMAPTIVERGDSVMALGSGGSNRIRSAILQVLTNLIDRQMSVEDAVCAARIHLEGELLSVEGSHSPEDERVLLSAGTCTERWQDRNLFFGGVHVVRQGPDGLVAVGDPRRGGVGIVLPDSG